MSKDQNSLSSLNENYKLDQRQNAIYNGLRSLREDIADLYLDGVRIFRRNDLKTKSNLLGHIAREIDDGLRDILTTKQEKDKIKDYLTNGKLGNFEEYKRAKDHVASILTALNCDLNSEIATEWIDVATKFHKFAHIDKSRMKIRNPSKIEELWIRYEDILFWLVGTYYNYLERIDRILSYEEPSKQIINSLNNILQDEKSFQYFFSNLKSLKWVRYLKEAGYFDINNVKDTYEIEESPGSYKTPKWFPIIYLNYIAKENLKTPNSNITTVLLEIVDSYIEMYENFDNFWTDLDILEIIYNLPPEKIEKSHIEFIRTILKSPNGDKSFISEDIKNEVLPCLINAKKSDSVLHLLDIIFDYDNKNGQLEPIMDNDLLYDSLKEFEESIYNLCGIEIIQVLLRKINGIQNESYILTLSIDDHQDVYSEDYEYQIVHFLNDMFQLSNPKNLRSILEDMVNSENKIFKKLAIHAINQHYGYEDNGGNLKDLFWKLNYNPLEIYGLKPEIFSLLNSHYPSFTENEVKTFVNWIENKNYNISDDEKEDAEVIKACAKLKWLEAVKESENNEIKELYKKYKKVYPKEIKHPDRYISFEGLSAPSKPQKLCEKSNNEIVDFLNSSDKNELKSHFEDGNYVSWEKCIEDNPKKFSTNLDPFLNVSIKNQYCLLFNLFSACNDSKFFEFDELLDFILKILNPLWEQEYQTQEIKYKDWMISIIADLIIVRTKNEAHPLNKEILPKVCEILLILSQRTDSELDIMDNIIMSVINSPKGKIFEAMIYFSLYYAKLYKGNSKDKWLHPIKEEFSSKLKNPSTEFSVVLGLYLPNLLYLDEKWVKDNINEIFSETTRYNVLIGYLRLNIFRESIYGLIKENKYLENAILSDFNDRIANQNLVYQICSAYFYDIEDISKETSLIFKLIHNKDSSQLSTVINFFLINKDICVEFKHKIRPIWKEIFNVVSKNPENFENVLSDLSKLLVFFEEIDDEIYDWLKLSAKYIKINHNHRRIVKNLLKCMKKSLKKVAKLFIEMLNNGTYPDYPKDDIKKIVNELYEKRENKFANRICNMYGEKNMHFLRGIYRKYNELD